ncbi:MAG: sodium-dependent transporter [Lachnospiraceae bacterium]|nr:sodium-dependent transporter [Lachnospiraceae bacterium]
MGNSSENQKTEKQGKERVTFSGNIGYVLAVAGSAVGLGNIWRFPYLAAKYGGGMFLLVYLILMLTFGYALIVAETSLGRMSGKSPLGAFRRFTRKKSIRVGGWFNAIIPMLIVPYYCVIGGWVTKYLFEYLRGSSSALAKEGYFNGFVSNSVSAEFWFLVFAVAVFVVILAGVENGVEKVSKIMMPILIVLAVIIAVYSVTRPGAIEGVKYLLIPNMDNFSIMTVVAAMGQMFYSLSIAMGILYTYGSYLKKDIDVEKSTSQLELFDTAIALLAGLMIIPAVFAFSGGTPENLQAGPSLMFITIPKVFDSMGAGNIVGFIFFLMVLFAALTSAISLMETGVSTLMDELGGSRWKNSILMFLIMVVLGSASALGFGVWDFVKIFGMSILDFFDFLTNSIMMPIAALFTCILVVYVVGFKNIAKEVKQSSAFRRQKLFEIMIKYIVPVCLLIILISSVANVLGWIEL